MNGLLFGALIIGCGFLVYATTGKLRVTARRAPVEPIEAT
jgi:hypothetical protein